MLTQPERRNDTLKAPQPAYLDVVLLGIIILFYISIIAVPRIPGALGVVFRRFEDMCRRFATNLEILWLFW